MNRPALFLVLCLIACDGSGQPEVTLPADMTLKTGEQRLIKGLTVTFVGVEEDSRCPDNARCVWAGNAAVNLRIQGGADSVSITLNSGVEPRAIGVQDLRFTIVSLLPAPVVGAPVPASHDLTLRVESTR
ncbi:MAG TPA: hypothetical protein VJU15_09805 [Gemmatimonadales bacterium]|nr:hypothetical protein [Gemmatimonadales bacterium]